MLIASTCRIDTGHLLAAQKIFDRFSKTAPSESLNRTVIFVVRDAQNHTPFVPPSRIDAELSVDVAPRISQRTGRPVSRRTRNASVISARAGGRSFVPGVPFTWLIIGARAKPGSRYNQLTGHRYALAQHPLKGVPRSGFAAAMAAAVARMVNPRHSSSHFFQHAWTTIIEKLLPFVPAQYRRGLGSFKRGNIREDFGEVSPAEPGLVKATCTIDLRIGLAGENAVLDQKRNEAMHRILGPILQDAIDREFHSKLAEAARRGLADQRAALAAHGFVIDI